MSPFSYLTYKISISRYTIIHFQHKIKSMCKDLMHFKLYVKFEKQTYFDDPNFSVIG